MPKSKNNVVYSLAPLAGFTDGAFRRLCARHGADLTYTEMVSAAGLAHDSNPTRHLMEVLPGEGPVACQLFGANADDLVCATREVNGLMGENGKRFVEINLNAGCPVPKVVKPGAGSALIKNPAKIHDLLRAMVAETDLPVTLKTRPGPNPDTILMYEILDAAESAGAKGIILHGRFTSQGHGGAVHLDLLADLVSKARIPVTGNGGVVDCATARQMAETGVAGIMIGRGALANPWIFDRLKGELDEGHELSNADIREVVNEHIGSIIDLREQLVRNWPKSRIPSLDGMVSVQMHAHLFRYFSGRPGAAEMRRRLNTIRTIAEIHQLIQSLLG